jgi:hypothetical protein
MLDNHGGWRVCSQHRCVFATERNSIGDVMTAVSRDSRRAEEERAGASLSSPVAKSFRSWGRKDVDILAGCRARLATWRRPSTRADTEC